MSGQPIARHWVMKSERYIQLVFQHTPTCVCTRSTWDKQWDSEHLPILIHCSTYTFVVCFQHYHKRHTYGTFQANTNHGQTEVITYYSKVSLSHDINAVWSLVSLVFLLSHMFLHQLGIHPRLVGLFEGILNNPFPNVWAIFSGNSLPDHLLQLSLNKER